MFGSLTGRDPRSLGDNECSAYELGLDRTQVKALQQIALDRLLTVKTMTPAPLVLPQAGESGALRRTRTLSVPPPRTPARQRSIGTRPRTFAISVNAEEPSRYNPRVLTTEESR